MAQGSSRLLFEGLPPPMQGPKMSSHLPCLGLLPRLAWGHLSYPYVTLNYLLPFSLCCASSQLPSSSSSSWPRKAHLLPRVKMRMSSLLTKAPLCAPLVCGLRDSSRPVLLDTWLQTELNALGEACRALYHWIYLWTACPDSVSTSRAATSVLALNLSL